MRQFQHVLVAFGSNLPVNAAESAEIIRSAATSLSGHGMVIRRMSRLFASPCFPAGAGPAYVNAAALVEVGEGGAEVLAGLH